MAESGGVDLTVWRKLRDANKKLLHGRARSRMRQSATYYTRRVEYRRTKGEIGKAVKSVTEKGKQGSPMLSFITPKGWVFGPRAVKRAATAF